MNHPKIGIRPTIDGRQGGVREALEEQTMAMAVSEGVYRINFVLYGWNAGQMYAAG